MRKMVNVSEEYHAKLNKLKEEWRKRDGVTWSIEAVLNKILQEKLGGKK